MAYWDTSCLLKLYVPEIDSGQFREHLLDGAGVITSQITRLELCAVMQRKEMARDLNPGGARKALAAYDADVAAGLIAVKTLNNAVMEKFQEIIERSSVLSPPIWLRALDGIHLATASAAAETEIVATDKRLREAALGFGFVLYPPAHSQR